MRFRYSRLIVRNLLFCLVLISVILISACTILDAAPPPTNILYTPTSTQIYSTVSATTELQSSLLATSIFNNIPVTTTSTINVNSSAKYIPTKTLILYSDGQGIYSYPEYFAFSHIEIQTLYTSIKPIENFSHYLIRFTPKLSPAGDPILIPDKDGDKIWALSLAHGTLRQAVDKSVVTIWNPKGTQFAYLWNGGLYVQDIASLGVEPRLLFKTEKESDFVNWSPDGNWILSVERTGNDDYNFWLTSVTGEFTRLLGTFSLPATELSAESVFQWSPKSDLIWINTSNGNILLTLNGEIVDEVSLFGLEWVFCNTQHSPIECIQKTGIDELGGYIRIAPAWVLCQQNFWGFSHTCEQRVVFYQNRLYVNNLVSGDLQEVAIIDTDINSAEWTPDDEYLIFDTFPLLTSLQHEKSESKIYSLSLSTGEVVLLPVQGILLNVMSAPAF